MLVMIMEVVVAPFMLVVVEDTKVPRAPNIRAVMAVVAGREEVVDTSVEEGGVEVEEDRHF